MDQPSITPKQIEILKLIYKYRFLNRIQIQFFLNHKEPRRIKSWLKELTDLEYLNRIFSPKLTENTKPAIYSLNTKALKIIKTQPDINPDILKRFYKEKDRSQSFIDHSTRLAYLAIYFQRTLQENQKLHFLTKIDLSPFDYLPQPTPDAYVVIEDPTITKRYFLEYINPKTPRFAIRSTIKKYLFYYDHNYWQKNTNYDFPKILIICPYQQMFDFVKNYINKIKNDQSDTVAFYLAIFNAYQLANKQLIHWQEA